MLVVIPARGGSKGVPGKNIKELGGKPLIQYTIDAARELVPDNQIIVSTDSLEIKEVVESLGLVVPFLRPSKLATDTADTYEVLLHALDYFKKYNPEPNKIILLQPTSPLRTSHHIEEALKRYNDNLDMVCSVKITNVSPYYLLKKEDKDGYLKPFMEYNVGRRQDAPILWELNGAIYIINVKSLLNQSMQQFEKVKKYEMDEESSLDIDTFFDWKLAEYLIGTRNLKLK